MVNGNVSGGFAGITLTYGYNNRLQMSSAKASSSNGDVFDLSYSYNLGSGVNNGSVASITNNRNTSRTQLFTYDNLDRVATAKTQGTSGGYCWGQSFGYDRYGNLLTATVTQCSAPSLSLSVNTNNQITNSGFSYDATGNLKGDGTNSYTWNAEDRPTVIGSTTYKYDGGFLRVYKSSGTLEWPDEACTKPLVAETDTSGNTTAEYIWFAGQLIAHRDSSGNVYFHYSDHLASGRVMTNSAGVTQQESDFYPFGGELVVTNNVVNHHKFTSKYRDPETAFDYSPYRMYEPNLGRWASTDPIRSNVMDPQQLNRYNYVANKPVRFTDPSGGFIFDCIGETDFFDLMFFGDIPPESPFPTVDIPYCAIVPVVFLFWPRIPFASCDCSRKAPAPDATGRCGYNCTCATFSGFGRYQSEQSYILKYMTEKGCEKASKNYTVCPQEIRSKEINIRVTTTVLTECVTVH
jgi:RHS repeat-associated protein